MRESEIEKAVCDYAKAEGFLVRKFVSPNHAGVPDQLFWGYGEHFLIEFKAPGGRVNATQLREHKRLHEAGGKIFVVDSIDFGKLVIDGARIIGEMDNAD